MSGISAFTHTFRANLDTNRGSVPKATKRNRLPVSCQPCRGRKLKCNRGQPCDGCVKRGEEASCSYARSLRESRSTLQADSGSAATAKERLQHLEDLVLQLMRPQTPPASAAPERDNVGPGEEASTDCGHLVVQGNEEGYVGATNWTAILDNIHELRSALTPESMPTDEETSTEDIPLPTGIDTLFAVSAPPSLESTLRLLPPRSAVDRRLSLYFNAKYIVLPIMHTYQFQRQYEAFWRNQLETPLLWISQLFSMLCISVQLSEALGSEPSTPDGQTPLKDDFIAGSAQCLVLGDYGKPKRYVVEALLLYAQCRYISSLDPVSDLWTIFGLVVRSALRLGYHRDPKHFPNISPFDGEMRRRTWTIVRQFDLLASFQIGLPSSIQPDQCDTEFPRNLLDLDFDETTTELPPSRPETEFSNMVYFKAKSRLMLAFGKIVRQALCLQPISSESIMELDVEVRDAHASLPAYLKMKPMAQSFADPAYLLMMRLNCELLFQKCLCILHRGSLSPSRSNPHSRETCTKAAMEILKQQAIVHQESQPGGQLYHDRWMLSSFTFSDFFLAAMIICLDLSESCRSGQLPEGSKSTRAKFDAIQQSYRICSEQRSRSYEARRVSNAIAAAIARLEPLVLGSARTSSSQTNHNPSSPWQIRPVTPGATSPRPDAAGSMEASVLPLFDPSEDVDWALLDQYFLDPAAHENGNPSWPDPLMAWDTTNTDGMNDS